MSQERTAEDWGRVAVSLPGWRWMPGMLDTEGDRWGGVTLHDGAREVLRAVTAPKQYAYEWRDRLPDPDDPATAGCLLQLLGECNVSQRVWERKAISDLYPFTVRSMEYPADNRRNYGQRGVGTTLGRACIAAAEALGRWPGGAS